MHRDREEWQNPQTVAQGKACRYLAHFHGPDTIMFFLTTPTITFSLYPLSFCLYPFRSPHDHAPYPFPALSDCSRRYPLSLPRLSR